MLGFIRYFVVNACYIVVMEEASIDGVRLDMFACLFHCLHKTTELLFPSICDTLELILHTPPL